MEKVSNVHYVDGQELDEVERTIFATAYVAKLMRPNEGPQAFSKREVNGEEAGATSAALSFAAYAVVCFRVDLKAR